MSTRSPRRAVFVHIPRTAGKSFGRMLNAIYEGRQIVDFYGDSEQPVVNGKIEQFCRQAPACKEQVDLVKGHVVYGFDAAFQDAAYVTLLRQPLQRLVSYYYYALKDSQNYLHDYLLQRRIGLEAFLASDASIDLDNYHVRAISGQRFGSSRERVTQAHCELAKERLAHDFTAFGLTEQLDQSLRLIGHAMGWSLPPAVHINAGSYDPNVAISDACRSYILEKNRFDVELYDFAQALFSSRLATLPTLK